MGEKKKENGTDWDGERKTKSECAVFFHKCSQKAIYNK